MDYPNNCPKHGDFSDPTGRASRSACPACEAEAQRSIEEWRTAWRMFDHWSRDAMVPQRYRNRTVCNWNAEGQTKTVADTIRRYAETIGQRIEAGDGLTLIGPPGLGKTHLLVGLVHEAHRAGHRAIYCTWPELADAQRQAMKTKGPTPIDTACRVPLLALDEIALGNTEWSSGQLFELIDWRYGEGLATCVACNASTATLPKVIGERIADRLRETNAVIALTGNSKRGQFQITDGPALTPPPDSISVEIFMFGAMATRAHKRT